MPKLNRAIINVIIYTCAFPAKMKSQNVFYETRTAIGFGREKKTLVRRVQDENITFPTLAPSWNQRGIGGELLGERIVARPGNMETIAQSERTMWERF